MNEDLGGRAASVMAAMPVRGKHLIALLTGRPMKNRDAWWLKMNRNFLPALRSILRRGSGLKTVLRNSRCASWT